MPWQVTVRYQSDKFPDSITARVSTIHEEDPILALQLSISRIVEQRNFKLIDIVGFTVEKVP